MKERHLNDLEISGWMAGERPAELAGHLESCVACRAEVDEFAGTLASFRESVRGLAEGGRAPAFEAPVGNWSWGGRWVLAAVLAALIAAVPLFRQNPPAEVSDSALFDQVNTQLARRVPDAMEPLAALAWPVADDASTPKSE